MACSRADFVGLQQLWIAHLTRCPPLTGTALLNSARAMRSTSGYAGPLWQMRRCLFLCLHPCLLPPHPTLQDYDPVHLVADWDDLYVCCAEAKRKNKIDSDCTNMPPRPAPMG